MVTIQEAVLVLGQTIYASWLQPLRKIHDLLYLCKQQAGSNQCTNLHFTVYMLQETSTSGMVQLQR